MRRFLLPRTFSQLFLLTVMVLVSAPQSLAAAADFITIPDGTVVTRGEFIRGAVKALDISPLQTGSLPYARVPRALAPYIRAAEKKGALAAFGKDLALGRGITRIEALEVLVLLGDKAGEPATAYRDLKTEAEQVAAQVALDNDWMEAESATVFGARQVLTGAEARLLLRKVLGEGGPVIDHSGEEDSIPTIRVQFKPAKAVGTELPKSQILESVWKIITEDYYHGDDIEEEEAGYSAAEALVKSLEDPYSTFLRPKNARDFQSRIEGEVSGIGVQVEDKAGVLTVVTPLSGSPAERAGMKPGDEILAVDGVSIVGIGYLDAVDKVRGKAGTKVLLHIRRNGAEFDLSVIRETIKVPEIKETWQGNIAIVQLVQFGKLTETDLRPLMEKINGKNPRGVILDLRNNPGGLLNAAGIVASNFLPKGSPVALIRSRTGETTEKTLDPPTISPTVPLVVLVNDGSASASEIVAGALQDAGRATIVGIQTFGKGTVQEVLEFTDGSSLKLTIAEWLTPKGRKIDGLGVKPDVVVQAGERDEQLTKAIDLIRGGR
ncbi:MAG: S41 family peptidase [Candidatus Peribacteraceae bacterium]|nr:S41 family peptidase [Candidatus Peribacteraceae bacterium]